MKLSPFKTRFQTMKRALMLWVCNYAQEVRGCLLWRICNHSAAPTNLVGLLKTLTPSSCSWRHSSTPLTTRWLCSTRIKPALQAVDCRDVAQWNRQQVNALTFSGSVPDTLVSSRNSATKPTTSCYLRSSAWIKTAFLPKWQHVNHSVEWCGVYCHNHQIIAEQ